ncbi:SPOR domain-containing protein [Stutzerimonas nitrititolerans]|uniref:SPOR domain-containing protein n=1 Tax=Stutzerimonas nitrititolerans TaxID=2482751 RepID=UPI0028A67DF2|nr:SPOR domain-containing protein [Stutzerimonas nitrititolerans]
MTGKVVKLEGDALGYHLSKGKGWSHGYVVILNLTVIRGPFATREEAQKLADSIPAGWEPEPLVFIGDIPQNL